MVEQRPMGTGDMPTAGIPATPVNPAPAPAVANPVNTSINTDAASVQATEAEKQARMERARAHMQEHRAIEDRVRAFHTHFAESDAATDAMLADFDRLKAEHFPEAPGAVEPLARQDQGGVRGVSSSG